MRIQRVLAPNPGPYTGEGTNTWVVGDEAEAIVIDPGPRDTSHSSSIVATVAGRSVAAVIVTHTHPDHAPLANPLARDLVVPALGYAPGPEFEPDELLSDGSQVSFAGSTLDVLYTPGHSDDHLCFRLGTVLFTGDHIMGGSSVMVDDLGPYLRSLERLRGIPFDRLYPGHGPEIDNPSEVIDWYIAHRRQREQEILTALGTGASTVGEVVENVYADVSPDLYPLAARSVSAHLRKLAEEGSVRFSGSEWDDPVWFQPGAPAD